MKRVNKTLVWVQTFLNTTLLVAYSALLVFYIKLIKNERERLGFMMRQVIIFFTVMLLMLIVNFVLELVFYYYMISPVYVKSQKRVI